MLAAARGADLDDQPRPAGRRRHLPQPGAGGQDHHDAGHHLRRPRGPRHRRAWFEEEHIAYGYEFPPLKERFERLEDAPADHPRDVHAGRGDLRRQALPRRRRAQQPEADPRRHPDPDRRQRRAQDAALRRQVRRRLQPLRRRRARQAPARRPRGPLRGRRPRPGRDHQDARGAPSSSRPPTRPRRRSSRPSRRPACRRPPRASSSATRTSVAEQAAAFPTPASTASPSRIPDVLRPRGRQARRQDPSARSQPGVARPTGHTTSSAPPAVSLDTWTRPRTHGRSRVAGDGVRPASWAGTRDRSRWQLADAAGIHLRAAEWWTSAAGPVG